MTANLFGERFYSLRRPAWHGLGYVSNEELGAVAAFSRITPFDVSLEPLVARIDGVEMTTSVNGIFRHPVPDDPHYRLLGTVGSDYRLISPLRLCELYDEHVQYPVETLGALGNGSTLFLSTRLNSFDVKGDEIESYVLIESPYTGNSSIKIRITPVRVVCQNTLIVARRASTETYAIRHDARAETDLGIWLSGIVARAENRIQDLREMFEKMASKRVRSADLESLLEAIFPDPKLPNLNHPDPLFVERQQSTFEEASKYTQRARETVRLLFEGAGIGQDTPAAAGTAFGLFNAVAERAQYASNIRKSSGLWDVISGVRSAETERAFSVLWNFSTVEDTVYVPAEAEDNTTDVSAPTKTKKTRSRSRSRKSI